MKPITGTLVDAEQWESFAEEVSESTLGVSAVAVAVAARRVAARIRMQPESLPEPPVRRALRELVDAVNSCQHSKQDAAVERAQAVLRDEP